jgi:hypothetical protein
MFDDMQSQQKPKITSLSRIPSYAYTFCALNAAVYVYNHELQLQFMHTEERELVLFKLSGMAHICFGAINKNS